MNISLRESKWVFYFKVRLFLHHYRHKKIIYNIWMQEQSNLWVYVDVFIVYQHLLFLYQVVYFSPIGVFFTTIS